MNHNRSCARDLLDPVLPVLVKRVVRNAGHFLAAITVITLQGCSSPPAPSPTPNPHPTHTQKLKISVEKGSAVNRVEVESIWGVGDLSCAPVRWRNLLL